MSRNLRTSSTHQWASTSLECPLSPALPTSRLTTALGPHRSWTHSLASQHKLWGTLDSSASHYGIHPYSPAGQHQTQEPRPQSVSSQSLALPTSKPALAPGHFGFLQPATLWSGPANLWLGVSIQGRAWPLTELGSRSHLPHYPRYSAHHSGRTHTEGTLEAYSPDDQRSVRCWDTQDISHKRPLLQSQET